MKVRRNGVKLKRMPSSIMQDIPLGTTFEVVHIQLTPLQEYPLFIGWLDEIGWIMLPCMHCDKVPDTAVVGIPTAEEVHRLTSNQNVRGGGLFGGLFG